MTYVLATPGYIGTGHDGFDMLKPERNLKQVVDPHCSLNIIDVMKQFMKRASAEWKKLDPEREVIRQKRLALFNTSDDKDEDWTDDKKFIKLRPRTEGRIINLEKQ